jgi:hypothetical protein
MCGWGQALPARNNGVSSLNQQQNTAPSPLACITTYPTPPKTPKEKKILTLIVKHHLDNCPVLTISPPLLGVTSFPSGHCSEGEITKPPPKGKQLHSAQERTKWAGGRFVSRPAGATLLGRERKADILPCAAGRSSVCSSDRG